MKVKKVLAWIMAAGVLMSTLPGNISTVKAADTMQETVETDIQLEDNTDLSMEEALSYLSEELILNGNNGLDQVCSRLNLPAKIGEDIEVTWETDVPGQIDVQTGAVTMSDTDVKAKLTATLKKEGGQTETKGFDLTIVKSDQVSELRAWYTAMDGSKGTVDLFPDEISYLRADHAELGDSGLQLRYVENFEPKGSYVRSWTNGEQSFSWQVNVEKAGEYHIDALMMGSQGVTIRFADGENVLNYTFEQSGMDKYDVGTIYLPQGTSTLTLSADADSFSEMVLKSLELKPVDTQAEIDAAIEAGRSKDTDWMPGSIGVMFQWGPWGGYEDGTATAWPDCYAELDYEEFAKNMKDMGVDYVTWSLSWWEYYLPAPIQAAEDVYPGRTTIQYGGQDYLGELLDALQNEGIRVLIYYHPGHDAHNAGTNVPFWNAFWDVPQEGHYARKENAINDWLNIIREIGLRYGEKIDGWLFDDGSTYYPAPFDMVNEAVRAGNPDRLLSFNSWIDWQGPRLTDYQDLVFGNALADGAVYDSILNEETGMYEAGIWKGCLANYMIGLEPNGWGILAGQKGPLTCSYSQEQITNWIRGAKLHNRSLQFSINMWADGKLGEQTTERIKQGIAAGEKVLGENLYNDSDPDITYTGAWEFQENRGAGNLADDIHSTRTDGDKFAYTFTGTGIGYIAEKGPDLGEVDIYIDGEYAATIDAYQETAEVQQELFSIQDLDFGEHVLECVKKSGDYMRLDALQIYSDVINNDAMSINYHGSWQYNGTPNRGFGDINDDVHYTMTHGDYFEYTFEGTGIDYITEKDSAQGEVEIYLDGEYQTTVNTYTDSERLVQQAVYSVRDLPDGQHTLKCVMKSGTFMLIDALRVYGPQDPSDTTEVSKKPLEYFLDKAKQHQEAGDVDGCVESIRTLFKEAIEEGEAVMADENATRKEVMDAAVKLMKAIHALDMKTGDKTDLEMALELTEMIDLDKYVEEGQAEYLEAKENAENVMNDGDAFQEDVDAAWNALTEALGSLRLKADKSVLQDLLKQTENLDLTQYTEESVQVFWAAFAKAQSVLADEGLSVEDQNTVDEAVKELKAARDGLTAAESGEDENSGGTNAQKAAKTGDNSAMLMVWLLLAVAAGSAGYAVFRKGVNR